MSSKYEYCNHVDKCNFHICNMCSRWTSCCDKCEEKNNNWVICKNCIFCCQSCGCDKLNKFCNYNHFAHLCFKCDSIFCYNCTYREDCIICKDCENI